MSWEVTLDRISFWHYAHQVDNSTYSVYWEPGRKQKINTSAPERKLKDLYFFCDNSHTAHQQWIHSSRTLKGAVWNEWAGRWCVLTGDILSSLGSEWSIQRKKAIYSDESSMASVQPFAFIMCCFLMSILFNPKKSNKTQKQLTAFDSEDSEQKHNLLITSEFLKKKTRCSILAFILNLYSSKGRGN